MSVVDLPWRLDHTIYLGPNVGRKVAFAPFVDAEDEDVRSAIHLLNQRSDAPQSRCCIIFCYVSIGYYLLYQSRSKEHALRCLAEHMREANLTLDMLPKETAEELLKVSQQVQNDQTVKGFVTNQISEGYLSSRGPCAFSGHTAVQHLPGPVVEDRSEDKDDELLDLREELARVKQQFEAEIRRRQTLEATLNHFLNNSKEDSTVKEDREGNIDPKDSGFRSQTSDSDQSTIEDDSGWDLYRNIPLGPTVPDPACFPGISLLPANVTSLRHGVTQLNSGNISCECGLAIVFSESSLNYHLLYRKGTKVRAQKIVLDAYPWLSGALRQARLKASLPVD